jgi:predicted dienelactone hydrolase
MPALPTFSCRRPARPGRAAALLVLSAGLALAAGLARAATGLAVLPASGDDGPVTLFYPTQAASQTVQRGPFSLPLVPDAAPVRGNGRLVVVSHGSGGGPWVMADLAQRLVQAGYVVALPEHRFDNVHDSSGRGPVSWALRPGEVSRAIDAVGRDPRLAPLLVLDQVGVYGMSAGGHTALALAGGRWSPALLRAHCDAHLAEDFQTCVGLATRLTGGWADGAKLAIARRIIDWRLSDERLYSHHDPRVAAVVAGVPLAADFDLASLARPKVPLGLVTVGQDRWLVPRFHSDRVLAACLSCERVADLPAAGHGALLSPLPPGLDGLIGDLLNDPPGFDRAQLPEVDQRITDFFDRHLRPVLAASR